MDKFHAKIIEKRIKRDNIKWLANEICLGIIVIILASILGNFVGALMSSP